MRKFNAEQITWNGTDMESETGVSPLAIEGQEDSVKLYLRDIEQYPLLSPEEEKQLASRIAKGDQDARQTFIQSNLRLVVSIAKDYRGQGIDFLDLIQEGNHGLLKAVEQFSLARECRFSTYATWWIKERIMHALSKREELMVSLFSVEEEGDIPLIDTLQDTNIAAPETSISLQQMRGHLLAALSILTEREQQVIVWRYGLGGNESYSYAEIARSLSISPSRVRQIEQNALDKLRSSVDLRDCWAEQSA